MDLPNTLLAFNRGLVSRLGLARVDVKRIASLSAEEMTNFLPRVLGSMSIRPGWKYLGATNGNLAVKLIPFVFSVDDTALIEISASTLRVWRNDALITRGTVGTGIVNGLFDTDLSDWTDNDESGATSSWLTGGYMQLLGDGTNSAIRDQAVTVSGGDAGDEHAMTIVIAKGPVRLRVGSAIGTDNYITETLLGTGTHSLSFTPAGSFWIRFSSRLSRPVLVESVAIEAAGVMTVVAPWSASDLDNLRWDTSGDIVFVAAQDKQPYMIERRSTTSWSVVKYEPEDGPFRIENITPITLTASAITGSITITASKGLFRSGHVGALFSLTSEGQTVTSNISSADSTNAIRITGVDASRVFTIVLSGTWTGTVTLQRSLDSEDGPWETVSTVSWTANTTETFDDGLDNQIAWYRLTFAPGTGTVVATLTYALGAITGVARITAYTDSVTVSADVLSDLGGTSATEVWAEGEWSTYRGWPTAVGLHEGRLWWGGKSKVWGSVSDAYDSFDPDTEGDSGPITRSLASGPVDRINWLFSSGRLLLGGDLNEYAARSSSLDEPLTPTNFNVKGVGSQGSAAVMPGRIDAKAIFANRTGMKVFELAQSQGAEYSASDLCALVPDIGDPGIVRVVVQRQPDTRVHCIRSDGTVALAVVDRAEDVLGWCEIETLGEVEDAAVLPAQSGVTDDYVYYIVKRTINNATVRYLEKWSQAREGLGGIGTAGTGSPFESFDQYQVSLADDTGTEFFYSQVTGKLYATGTTTDLIWVYDPANFPAYTQIDTGYLIRPPGQTGAMSDDGTYLFLSGNASIGQEAPVHAVNLSTGVVTALGGNDDVIVIGATASYLMVSEGGTTKVYTYSISGGTRTLLRSWAISPQSSVLRNGVWDAAGAFWIFVDTKVLLRFHPTSSTYTSFTPSPALGVGIQLSAQVTYDSTRDRLIMGFTDGTIRAFSDWTAGVDDSGTWTTLKSSQTSIAVDYEATTDSLIVVDYTTAYYVYRYYMPTFGRIDRVLVQDTVATDVPYDLQAARTVVYLDGSTYVLGTKSGTEYLIKINYEGDPILYDSDGNSLQSGGNVDRLNALADSFIEYTGVDTTSITGLSHLEGEEVVVWANGVDLGTDENYEQTFTVDGGAITLDTATSNVTVGLPYWATFKSTKLGLQIQGDILFGKEKRIASVALVLANTHAKGVRFGPDFDTLDDRAGRDEWADVDPDNIDTDYDNDPMMFPGGWSPDTRICLKAQAPRPCTVLAVKLEMEV